MNFSECFSEPIKIVLFAGKVKIAVKHPLLALDLLATVSGEKEMPFVRRISGRMERVGRADILQRRSELSRDF